MTNFLLIGIPSLVAGYALSCWSWPKVRLAFNGARDEIKLLEAKVEALKARFK